VDECKPLKRGSDLATFLPRLTAPPYSDSLKNIAPFSTLLGGAECNIRVANFYQC
jgi:hypothetical protein